MRKYLLVNLILLALMSVSSYATAANLLTNPGFETGDLTGWNTWQPENTQMYDWGHNSSSCVGGWWAFSGLQHVDGINPNTPHNVGGYLYDNVASGETMQGGVYATIEAQFKNASDIVVGTWTTGNITGADLIDDDWNNLTAQVTPSDYGSDITRITFKWEVNNTGTGGGRGIFDDLTVAPIPEPSTMLLLGTGLFGLAGLVVKKKK